MFLAIVLAVAMLVIKYPEVAEWNLGDNDNFMRLHQVMTFIESPSWHLQPLTDFNPQDGQIIHWSRIPDLPILVLYYVSQIFVDHSTALQFSIAVVPLIYLIAFIYILCQISQSIFGVKHQILTVLYTFFSIAAVKFYPGNIDHHNLQILLYSCFILFTFSPNFTHKAYIYSSAISISISLLIGLEVLPFFIITLALLTIYALYNDPRKLKFIRDLSLLTFLFGVMGIMIFQPVSIWFNPQYDILTLPLLCFFLAAAISLSLTLIKPKLTILLITSIACISLTWFCFPNVLKSPYSEYPEPLVTYWLSHVSEARPLTTVIKDSSDLSQTWLYLVTIIPAAMSIFLLSVKKQRLYYILFLISLIPAIFWQVRTIVFSSILAIPLNLIVGLYLFNIIKTSGIRIILPILLAPALSSIVVIQIEILLNADLKVNSEEKNVETLSTQYFIKQLGIENKKIFAPMDSGAEIVTLTDNYIITAPYHRNIRGNLLYVSILLSDDYQRSYKLLREEGVNLFIFNNNDPQIKYILSGADDKSLVKLLSNNKPPKWLTTINKNDNGITIYSIN
ncbi:hypothetical protein [Vibrio natriegens]|uniref:hypothetical protein n=1 Tax=Vibrio natriegens TaxID=691 RepID=UPI000803FB3E|nr:hypothetical protein [Vibrio natriegens]ANQ18020.1 hypothetical protein BA891_12600 [Vibrio natriegens]